MAAMELHGLTERFGPFTAVDDMTLEIGAGTISGLLGPNGAGKTTTLRMLLGLVTRQPAPPPSTGAATSASTIRPAGFGAVLEASSFHPGRRAINHLRVLASAAGFPERRADEAMARVGLEASARRRVGGFSLGMRQRSAWRRRWSATPAVLILDEPTNGLDPEGVHWVRSFLREQAANGRTVVVSSHLLSEVSQTVDHVVILDGGRLVRSAPLAELSARSTGGVVVRTPEAPRQLTAEAGHARGGGPGHGRHRPRRPRDAARAAEPRGRLLLTHRRRGSPVVNRLIRTELLKHRTPGRSSSASPPSGCRPP